jgi:uncharacterized protein YndB with AHSA1/START domain
MNDQALTIEYAVRQTPEQVFAAFTDPRAWWSENIRGGTSAAGDEFDYAYQDVHRCRIRLTEVVPGRSVVWHVLENHFDFVADEGEWVGTEMRFEAAPREDGGTDVRFSHVGLVPAYECYDVCTDAWGFYIRTSLRNLITTGQGEPTRLGQMDAGLLARAEGRVPQEA